MDSGKGPKEIRKELRKANLQCYEEDIGRVETAISAENLRPATLSNYASYLKILAAWLVLYADGITFRDVDVDRARQFVEFLKTQLKLAPNTVNGYLAAVRKMFAVIQEKEVTKRILPDMAVDTRLPCVPSVEQVGRMIDACRTRRELLFIAILISTGMRFCELLYLKFRDILRDKKAIYISASKGRADGYAPLTNRVLKLLTEYCQEYNKEHPKNPFTPDDYIFHGYDRNGPEKAYRMRRIYFDIKQRAGLEKEAFNLNSRVYFVTTLDLLAAMEWYPRRSIYPCAG